MTDYLPEPYLPVDVDDVDVAFPAGVRHLMPDPTVLRGANDSGRDYCDMNARDEWARFWSEAFFSGVSDIKLQPRDDIDQKVAWRHLRCILGSYEPKHEHKEGALRFLSERWFASVKWKSAERKVRA